MQQERKHVELSFRFLVRTSSREIPFPSANPLVRIVVFRMIAGLIYTAVCSSKP